MAAAPTQASPAASGRTIPARTDGGLAFSIDVAGADDVVIRAAWAAMPMAARIGVMQCWLGGVAKRADAIRRGRCRRRQFIPMLIDPWRQGRFPFDRLPRFYPFADIAAGFDDIHHGRAIKPVLLMDGAP